MDDTPMGVARGLCGHIATHELFPRIIYATALGCKTQLAGLAETREGNDLVPARQTAVHRPYGGRTSAWHTSSHLAPPCGGRCDTGRISHWQAKVSLALPD
jgi:hypothetical protein